MPDLAAWQSAALLARQSLLAQPDLLSRLLKFSADLTGRPAP